MRGINREVTNSMWDRDMHRLEEESNGGQKAGSLRSDFPDPGCSDTPILRVSGPPVFRVPDSPPPFVPEEPYFLKFRVPDSKRMIRRGRLIRKLEENAGSRTVIVSGQAAQGKTTLIADYLSMSKAPAAWMHLDGEDGDPANFYILLIRALKHAAREDVDLTDLCQPPGAILGRHHEPARYKAGIRAAFDRFEGPVNLVLDSIEAIPSDAAAMDLVQYLLHQTPPGARLFIVSRKTPDLRLHDLKIKREAFVVDNADLAFDRNEIRELFNFHHGVELEDEHLDRLIRITCGWIGGLVIISQALLRLESDKLKDYILEGLPAEIRGETLRYFEEVIFTDEPADVRNLLIKTAIFEEVDPEIAAELTGIEDPDAVFGRLVRRNLFLRRYCDSEKGVLYRYNHMFRDFLRSLFRTGFGRKEQKALYAKAGELYVSRRRREDAVGFFVLAEDFEAAAEAVRRVGVDMCIRGRFRELEGWLESIPRAMIDNDPWLFLLLTLTRRFSGGKRSLEDFRIVLERFKEKGDARGKILTLAYLIESAIFQEYDLNVRRRWLEEARELLKTLGSVPYYTYARTLLWLQIGFGYISGGLDVQKGLSASRNAYLLASKMGVSTLQANVGIVSVLGFATSGEFSEAEKIMDRVRPLMGRDPCPEYVALQHLIDGQLRLKKGELECAARSLESVREQIETYGLLFLYPEFLYVQGQLQIRRGECQQAMATFGHLLDVSVMSGNVYHRGLAQRLKATALFFQNRPEPARKAAEDALSSFREMAGDTVHLMRTRLMLGLICVDTGKFEEGAKEFESAMAFFENNGHGISVAETLICKGLLARDAGRRRDCRASIEAGFGMAAKAGYSHFAVLRPSDLLRACSLAIAMGDAECVEYAKNILSGERFRGNAQAIGGPSDPGRRGSSVASAAKSKIEWSNSAGKPEILEIFTLGGFRAQFGEQGRIGAGQWGGRRSKLLLKAIVVHGGRGIPSDILSDDLWPDSSGKSARRNLKVTLHRLRKALEPNLDFNRGSAYVHLKDNLVSLDRNLCRADVDEFQRCCKDSRRREIASDANKVLELCERAAEIYKGDFLPEEPYEPWIETRRLALREEYVNALFRTVEIRMERGDLEEAVLRCAQIVEAEPILERANRTLMRIYHLQGRKAEALKTFENFRKRLAEDIGIAPDASTVELYRGILAV